MASRSLDYDSFRSRPANNQQMTVTEGDQCTTINQEFSKISIDYAETNPAENTDNVYRNNYLTISNTQRLRNEQPTPQLPVPETIGSRFQTIQTTDLEHREEAEGADRVEQPGERKSTFQDIQNEYKARTEFFRDFYHSVKSYQQFDHQKSYQEFLERKKEEE